MLRPYQELIVEQTRQHMLAGKRTILIQSPTGSGKTILTAHMLKTSAERGMSSFFTVHRRELVKQSIRAFDGVGVAHGVVAAGFIDDPRHLVQVCSVGTLARRWQKLKRPKLVIWDEAHHIAAAGWSAIHAAMPDAFHIGLTATPERLDGRGLSKWFEVMVKGPSVAWLIENSYLCPYKLFAPTSVNTSGMHTKMGDFARSELVGAMDKPSITGDAVREYSLRAPGKRGVAFCVSVEHSKHVAAQFTAAGFKAEHVDGETPADQRDASIRRFERGETKILSNVDLFGEGFDLPALEVPILLRPTQSLALYLQQCGRGLRPAPGKAHATILDHAGNCARHGLPDEDREWTLEGRQRSSKKKDEVNAGVKICPSCFAAQWPGRPACLYCSAVFELKPRQVDEVEGDLTEVNKDTFKRRAVDKERHQAITFTELVELGKKRGYKKPHAWAKHIWNYRQSKKIHRGKGA